MDPHKLCATIFLIIIVQSKINVYGLRHICKNNSINLSKVKVDHESHLTYLEKLVFINIYNGANKDTLTCSHPTKPVKWEIYSPNSGILDVILNIYWRNATSHYFGSFTITKFFMNRNSQATFTCRSTEGGSDPCESVTYILNNDGLIHTQEFLEKPRAAAITVRENSSKSCDLVLRYRVNGKGSLVYRWETSAGEMATVVHTIKKTASPDYFQGLYATEPQSPSCVEILAQNETQNLSKVGGRNEILSGVIFRAYFRSNHTFVAKGVFDVFDRIDDQRKFYWSWEIKPELMIRLTSPSAFYINKTEKVSCTISGLFFAVGAALSVTSLDGTNISRLNESESNLEIYKPTKFGNTEHGMRELTRQFVFHEESESEEVVCRAPLIDFSRFITKHFKFPVIKPEKPVISEPIPGEKFTLNAGESKELVCTARAKPVATIKWIYPVKDLQLKATVTRNGSKWETTSKIIISNFQKAYEGTYLCVASNYLDTASSTIELELPKSLSKRVKSSLIGGLASVTIVLISFLGMMYRKIKLQRRKYDSDTMKAKEEFLVGIPNENATGTVCPSSHMQVSENGTSELQPHEFLPFMSQPFDHAFNVPLENWSINEEILGMGNFGMTRKASVRLNSHEQVAVAVKTLLNAEDIDEYRRFLYELKLMQCLSFHPNIVSLVACCIGNIDERDVLIGVEFCSKGNLGEYLQKHGPKLTHFIRNNFSQEPSLVNNNFINVSVSPECLYLNLEDNNDLTDLDLYKWSHQIAQGMEFLASMKVLHGDLAVRNILLTGDKVAKIADFGLSRHLDENLSYKKKSDVRVPWKYLALESLTARNFSTKSDVWAYGITLWEIFSLGKSPYAGSCMGEEFVIQLRNGMRLKKPEKATICIYELMTDCWNDNPNSRPSFTELKNQFAVVVEQINVVRCNTSMT